MPPKKSRTPPPPRRPQGPRPRTASAENERRNRIILYALGASGLIGLVLVLALFAFAGGSSSSAVESAMSDAGCSLKTYKELPRTPHLAKTPPAKPVKYNSFPPSSGRHYFQTITYGFYDQPVDKYTVVHNLEHGAVLVYWGNKVPKSEVAKIREWWKEDARGIIASPLPALGNQIAEVAWTRVAKCPRFDENALSKFRDAYQFKGPEQIPPESMDPGAQ